MMPKDEGIHTVETCAESIKVREGRDLNTVASHIKK